MQIARTITETAFVRTFRIALGNPTAFSPEPQLQTGRETSLYRISKSAEQIVLFFPPSFFPSPFYDPYLTQLPTSLLRSGVVLAAKFGAMVGRPF